MIGVMIVPTGIGCEIGGHAGDATPVAKLLASLCDTLIIHPNVVNASDINEMPDNCLYVEGSMLDNFLEGNITLKPVKKYNRILLAVNKPITHDTINAVSAARVTIGADIKVLGLDTELKMIARYDEKGCATGDVLGWKELISQVSEYDFDALAIQTAIDVPKPTALQYLECGGINPWGGVEAICSRIISQELSLPVAHAPFDSGNLSDFNQIVDPRMAAETVSNAYLHCILKGLHRSPQIGDGSTFNEIKNTDVDFMVSPWACSGRPHLACKENNIPIIAVRENETCLKNQMPMGFIEVDNYLEAAGYISTMKAGVTVDSIRRPMNGTWILNKPNRIND